MVLNLIKLCVGAESVEDLETWIGEHLAELKAAGRPAEQVHTTRMTPKRGSEIVGEGSLYWVIKGYVQARQRILDLRPVRGADGIDRCEILLEPAVVRTRNQPKRPFQGWRYLDPKDAPPDAARGGSDDGMPAKMRRELAELGLI